MSQEVGKIAVIGAGTMGSGISLVAATSGIDAFQVDVSAEQLERAKKYHAKVLSRNVEKGRMTEDEKEAALSRVTYCSGMEEASSAEACCTVDCPKQAL